MAKIVGGAAEKFQSSLIPKEDLVESTPSLNLPEHDAIASELDEEMREISAGIKKLQQELAQKKELQGAVQDIPILFDTNDFDVLIDHLTLLKEAGVEKIKIGEKAGNELTISDITAVVEKIIEDFSNEKHLRKIQDGTLTDDTIINILRDRRGVTGDKISAQSAQGFRGCVLACIKTMSRRAVDKTETDSEYMSEADAKNAAKLKKRIQESE